MTKIISSLISIILSIFTLWASSMTPSYVAPVPEMEKDDFVPVMRFVATSDTHIETLGDTGCQRTAAMIKTAYAISEADEDYKNLDAVVFSGDITDHGFASSFFAFAAVTDFEIREGTERLAVLAKAHDSYTLSKNSLKLFKIYFQQVHTFSRIKDVTISPFSTERRTPMILRSRSDTMASEILSSISL